MRVITIKNINYIFTYSNTGKRLMAKCRLLYQENEELGRMIASGRIAKLEGELALQKKFSEEVKKSQSGIVFNKNIFIFFAYIYTQKCLFSVLHSKSLNKKSLKERPSLKYHINTIVRPMFIFCFIFAELDEFLQDLDEDVEGMQSTIYFLQQELRKARESVTLLQQENATLKANTNENNMSNGLSPHTPPIKKDEPEDTTLSDTKPPKLEDSGMCKGVRTPPLTSPTSELMSAERTERADRKLNQTDHNDESSSDSAALIIKVENEELSDKEEEHEESRNKRTLRNKNHRNSGKSNGEEVIARTTRNRDRTKREKSAASSDDERTHKKKRRESILSLDYNEADDDALVLTNGETLQSDPE